MNTNLQQQIAVTLLPHFGKKRVRTIIKHLGSLDAFFKTTKKDLLAVPSINQNLVRRLDLDLAMRQAEPYANFIDKGSFDAHFYSDNTFPKRLNECDDAPLLLFSYGNMNLNTQKVVSIVGTRNATSYGKMLCENLITSLREQNVLVVSGLAYGVDILAHQLCVENGLPTVAVLAHGLDRVYPAVHRKTAKKMAENGGLLTEYLPGTNPDRENFPMRNRIVAGMCDATIVIESGIKGGSLITADLANDYQRDVFAFPGDITREYSKGCNYLIQQNKAHLITSPDEFLTMMNWDKAAPPKQLDLFEKLSEKEKTIVLGLKERAELHFDQIIQYTKFSFSELSGLLLNLEFNGLIKTLPGKMYRLMIVL